MRDPPLVETSEEIAQKDAAETFVESDVTVNLDNIDNIEVVSESLRFNDKNTTTDADDAVNTDDFTRGIQINPNKDLAGVAPTLSGNTSGVTRIRISQSSDGTVIAEKTGGPWGGGDTIGITAELQSGTKYNVVTDAEGSVYDVGRDSSPSFPYSGTDLDVVSGGVNLDLDSSNRFTISEISSYSINGVAVVEWPEPNDVFRWDAASFQATEGGGTVEVYVEESTDGGSTWTEIAGPISRGDQIDADPGLRVRFRVELSRADTANNPTLDAIYRRWVV